jgi:hypothetical protein
VATSDWTPEFTESDEQGLNALAGWQERLSAHFETLAAARSVAGWPVFALEHGLTADEVRDLERDVRLSLAHGSPSRTDPLPWVVYAAEFGYRYAGDEYWQSFSAETPGWQYGWRHRMRASFQAFAKRYGGAEPEGAWAEWFRFIAWPITHGILPRDLQKQLARLLYEARFDFGPEVFTSFETLGGHLRSLSEYRSARFRQFAENSVLLGQLAAALLLQDSRASGGDAWLLPSTLSRIVGDINREREGQDWLAEARSVARARVQGIARLTLRETDARPRGFPAPTGRTAGDESPQAEREETRALAPKFVLRETAIGVWTVWLQLPNLRPVLERLPRAHSVLAGLQGRVRGSRVILAKSRLIREATPTVPLDEWPAAGATLLAFEGGPPELNAALDATFRGPPGDLWLFKIAADGQAYEVKSHVVRPGSSYLLLAPTPTEHPAPGLAKVSIQCARIYGLRLDMPSAVSDTLADVLGILDLTITRTLHVWPAGLPVSAWSGEGVGEWLVGDPVVLGLRADHPVECVTVSLDGGAPQSFSVGTLPAGQPAYVSLGALPDGHHRVVVAASARAVSGEAPGTYAIGGSLAFTVRTPRSAPENDATRGAVSFAVLPTTPTLEDVWEGRCEMHLAAPGARTVRCRIAFLEKGAADTLWDRRLTDLPLPLDTSAWRTAFAKQVRKHAAAVYDSSSACRIEFDAGALGRVRILAERDFTPLRWAVRDGGRGAVLIDSHGTAELSVCAYDCYSPDIPVAVDPAAAVHGVELSATGALLHARSGEAQMSVVVVPPQSITLTELARKPVTAACPRSSAELSRLLQIAAVWDAARVSANPLSETRRQRAVQALIGRILGTIGGERWAGAETAFNSTGDPGQAAASMKSLISDRRDQFAIGAVLARRAPEVWNASADVRSRAFVEVLAAFLTPRVVSSRDVDARLARSAGFALRLASSPAAAMSHLLGLLDDNIALPASTLSEPACLTAEPRLHTGGASGTLFDDLLASPVIARAARYFVLATAAAARARGVDAAISADADISWGWT